MRQPQQKSRGRGRGGRKPQNPLSRNFESNGPDVKIRGNANHIAEKYSTLARDALSSGDRVMAENYFQHAEHYNRIVAAAQAQNPPRQEGGQAVNGRGPQPQVEGAPAGETPAGETPAEVTPTDENKAQASPEVAENGAEAPAERRTRRPSPKKEAVPEDGEVAKAEPVSEEEATAAERISEDAAKLPGSITGGVVAEENS